MKLVVASIFDLVGIVAVVTGLYLQFGTGVACVAAGVISVLVSKAVSS